MNKKESVARVLSALFPGLGQIYMGEWISGLIAMALWGWFGLIISLPKVVLFSLGMVSFDAIKEPIIFSLILWIICMISVSQSIKIQEKKNKTNDERL